MTAASPLAPSNSELERAFQQPPLLYSFKSPTAYADTIVALWSALRRGDHRLAIPRLIRSIERDGFSWPWFDVTSELLRLNALIPRRWAEIGIAPGDQLPPPVMADILAQTSMNVVYSLRSMEHIERSREVFPDNLFDLCSIETECPAERHFVSTYRDAVRRDDLQMVPPFFPLDASYLDLQPRRRRIDPDLERP